MGLTFEQRQHLKQAVHKAAKASLTRHYSRHNIQLCNGCEVRKDGDEYTPGCPTCWDRKRRRAGRRDKTVNCDTCGRNMSLGALRRRKKHAGIHRCYACIRANCTGCGNSAEQYTRGCRTCCFRHSERNRKLKQAEQREAA